MIDIEQFQDNNGLLSKKRINVMDNYNNGQSKLNILKTYLNKIKKTITVLDT